MKKLKKSMKLIISLVCVFLVAVTAVVTVVLVTKKRDDSPDDPTPAAYALTETQKLLVDEINKTNSTYISSAKLDATKIDTNKLPTGVSVETLNYFDDSIVWSGSDDSYDVRVSVYDETSETYVWKTLSEFLQAKNIVTTGSIDYIKPCNNHILLAVSIDGDNSDWYVLTIANHDVTVEKKLKWSNDASLNAYHNLEIGDDFYVNLEKNGDKYAFKFYLYGSSVVKYSYEISDYGARFDYTIAGIGFKFNDNVLVEYSNGSFSAVNNNTNVIYYNFEKGNLVETRTEVTADNAKSYLTGGKYYTYSYKFVSANGTETSIDLGDYTKIASNYSGKNYFELFFQKVDESHCLLSGGEIVYYDYDLTQVLKYSAATPSSTIFYSDGTMVLTREGFFAGKSTVELSKYSNLVDQDSNLEFDRFFPNGSFALETDNDDFYIYNNKNQLACNLTFDVVVYFIDDTNVILSKNGLYYNYNLSTNNYEIVNFSKINNLDGNSPLYLLTEGGTRKLYNGRTVLKTEFDEVVVDSSNNNLVIVKSGSSKEYYYLSAKSGSGASQVSLSGNLGESSGSQVNFYAASSESVTWKNASNNSTYTEPEWYDYGDKVLYHNSGNNYTIKASHCITDGLYSGYTYFDFFEIAYNGSLYGISNTAYRPLRIYYQVTIGAGGSDSAYRPDLKIIAVGHITNVVQKTSDLSSTNAHTYSYKITNDDGTVDTKYYYFGSSNNYLDGRNSHLKKDNATTSTLDYQKTLSGRTSSYYAYNGDSIKNLVDSSSVEVYGNSLRVSLQFDIVQNTSYTLNLAGSKFGYTLLSGDVYYDSSAVNSNYFKPTIDANFNDVYNNSEFETWRKTRENYYNKLYYKTVVIGISENTTNYTELTSSSDRIITDTNAVDISKQNDNSALGLDKFGYYTYVSEKNYLNKTSSVIKFGEYLQERISGAKIIGITTLNSTDYTFTNSSLYSSGTYIDDNIEYRTYKDTNANSDDENLPKIYLTHGDDGYYTMQINNESSIYYDGGLNYYRFVYCIYAPEAYYIQLDYNINGESNSVKNEIDYLKKYAGLTIGQDGSVDIISYGNTWAYSKAETSDEFKNTTAENGKYEPNDFTKDTNRKTTSGSLNNEYTADVKQYTTKGELYYYVIVDGIKYYFQRVSSLSQKKYSLSSDIYFVAYRNIETLKGVTAGTYGNLVTSNETNYNKNFYADGDLQIIIKLNSEDKSKFRYHKKTNHVRTTNYVGHYSYTDETLTETSNTNYKITETFSFLYSDPILFTSNPEHIHYNFVGWKVMVGDYAGMVINTTGTAGVTGSTNFVTLSTNVNPFKDGSVNRYLAGSGNIYYNLWLLTNKSSVNNPIVLQAVWEPVVCEIDAIFYTVENGSSGTSEYKGLSYDKTEKTINDDLVSITNTGVLPQFYNVITDGSQQIINNNDGTAIGNLKIQFQYDPTKTLDTIYSSYVESILTLGYTLKPSEILSSDRLLKQFGSWAVENINRTGTEKKYIPINGDIYEEAKNIKINQFIVDTTTLTIYAYYSEALYKINTSLYPTGGATVDKSGKDYSSTSSTSYNNSAIYNDVQNYSKITMVVSGGTDGSTKYKYANYEVSDYNALTMANGSFYYLQKFETHYYVGDTINFLIAENNEKYYLSKIVFNNLTLTTNIYSNGAYKKDKFTLTLTRDTNGNWKGTAVGTNSGASLTVSFGSDGKLTIGTKNTSENVITIVTDTGASTSSTNGIESHYSITVENVSNPGNLNYSNQLFGNDGSGFELEVYFEAYTLKNESMSIEYVSSSEIDFDYNRLVMSSCQPLTNKEGKSLKTDGSEDAYVWFWSSKYLFAEEWKGSATTGYYLIYNSTMIPADYHEDFAYEDFIGQTLRTNDSVIIYYDNSTKMVYFPTQTESNTSLVGGTTQKTLSTTSYSTLKSPTESRTFYYSFSTSSGIVKYYLGITTYNNLADNGIYVMKKGSSTTLTPAPSDAELIDKYYESGCDEFYVKIIKSRTMYLDLSTWSFKYKYKVSIEFAIPEDSSVASSDGLYTSAGNTRVIAFDPEQSRTYYTSNYSDSTHDDYNFDLEYYITSITIGTDTFTFDNVYSKFDINRDDTSYEYSHLKMHCTNNGYFSSSGEGNYIKYMGSYYVVNDVYKLTLSNTTNKKGATNYYFFITKSEEDNFVRYFLIYDIDKTNYNQEAKVSNADYNIKFKIDVYEKNLEINVTEEDVYDVTAMTQSGSYYDSNLSFNIDYKKTSMQYGASNFKDKTETSSSFKSNYSSSFSGIGNSAEKYTFYQTEYKTSTGSTINSSNTLLKNYSYKNLINSISWSSSTKFYPSSATKFAISAKDGYIIKSISISLIDYEYTSTGSSNTLTELISFQIDDALSFEELINDSKYSYTGGNESNVLSKIRYVIADTKNGTTNYGLKITTGNSNTTNGKGLMFSNNASTAWSTKQESSYTLDQLFLLISSIYNDVVIDITTTSYVEFMFENGESESDSKINPLLRSEKYSSLSYADDGLAYANMSLSDTYLTICTKTSSYEIDATDVGSMNYFLRYYLSDTANGIKKGTIRLIFYGTGSLFKYGFGVLATTENHSVYFTNGRYYNEPATDSDQNAFRRLTDYSGRTEDDEVIDKADRSMKDKLVYMGYGDSSNKYLTGYYYSHENEFETNYKYFLVTEVHLNKIDVETSSYLYNNNITSTTNKSSATSGSKRNYNSSNSLNYKYYEESGSKRLYIGDGTTTSSGNFYIYQLDNTSKQQSWFNDTVLTNLEYTYYDGTKNWVNMTNGVSELEKVEMQGLDFSWTYYEIMGYKLTYIMIEIADIGLYYIKDVRVKSQDEFSFTSSDGIEFKFNIVSKRDNTNKIGRYYTLYPYVTLYNGDGSTNLETLFNYVALLSNNIKVSFVSMAESYTIYYYNYSYNSAYISTTARVDRSYQSIYYDNMTKLNATASMDGYTFVGWGSLNYFNGTGFTSRYSSGDPEGTTPSTWNTESSWYDPTIFFVQPGMSGEESAKLLYNYYEDYRSSKKLPGSAFYAPGGYFITDTGSSATQNYNFFASNINLFGSRYRNGSSSYYLYLYALFKANTYLIQFDVNSEENEITYLDYNSLGTFDCEFENNNTAFRVKNSTTTISFYVTFDTTNWYFISGSQSLMYSYKSENGLPYYTGDVVDSTTNLSTVVTDKFGYSWLGWWYEKYGNINERTSLSDTKKSQVVFGSSYLSSKYSTGSTLIVFNKTFYNTLVSSGSISDSLFNKQDFVYKGQHLSPGSELGTNGYVYFYDYSNSGIGNAKKYFDIGGTDYTYIAVSDYLNTFRTDKTTYQTKDEDGNNITVETTIPYYSKTSSSVNVLSYYDTCYGKECYKINPNATGTGYLLQLDKSNLNNLRTIKLYANWVNNEYTVIFDSLDTNGKVEQTGSSTADFTFTSNSKTFFFNSTALQDYLLGKNNNLPSRIGYDFVGWSFNHIKTDGNYASNENASLVSAVNSASNKLYLCSELLTEYTILSGLEGTSNLESNILMIKNDRLSSVDSDWILNADGTAEHLGDTETGTRYIYIFPVWKVQSFSVNISLNIGKENLKNLFDKDSNFAVGLYESANPATNKSYSGVSSKYYTYKTAKTTSLTNNSYYYNYFTDIVANVCFEIDFDQEFSDAKLSFGGKTYYLDDLFATSAGYYFLGLMYENNGTDYIVKNTLESYFKLNDGLTHHNSDGSIEYKQNDDDTTYKFDINSYAKLYQTDYISYQSSAATYYNALNMLNSDKASTNFGNIYANVYNYNSTSTSYKYLYIMSELSGGQYYLYVLHNNIKYYIVYYLSVGSTNKDYKDCITFDRTFLYYNEIVNDEVVAKYIIRFNSSGEPYYIDDTYNKIHELDLRIAMYTSARNTLYTSLSDGIIDVDNDANGSIITYNNSSTYYQLYKKAFAAQGSYISLDNETTREFTLYADWEIRQIEAKVTNGNNTGTSASNNKGLAGYYEIKVDGNTKKSVQDGDEYTSSGDINFYSNIDYNFLPYYNGRYLSEMAFEFDTFEESTNSGVTTFSMVHNKLVLKFEWKSSDNDSGHTISISKITLNNSSLAIKNTLETASSSSYVDNKLKNIDILSVIDQFYMGNTTSALKLYSYTTTTSEFSGRTDYNKATLKLTNLMCDLNITCKFSVQTFKVEVYNVEVDEQPTLIENGTYAGCYSTNFQTLTSMQYQSNKNEAKQGDLGIPYVSSINYNTSTMATVSTDCAASLTSYNVPYYFFITHSNLGGGASTDPGGFYGINYLYGNSYYSNGTLTSPILQNNNSLATIAGKITGANGSYSTIDGYWFEFDNDTDKVILKRYDQTTPVRQNKVIYGTFISSTASVKVFFYYLDNTTGQYVQYYEIQNEYTSGVTNSKIVEHTNIDGTKYYSISTLPSSNYSPWQNNKNFVGFIYLDSNILANFVEEGLNEKYAGYEYSDSNVYNDTTKDAYSAFALGKVSYDTTVDYTGYGSVLNYYYQNYIKNLTVIDLFKHRLDVVNNKYYTKTATITDDSFAKNTSILDAVRLNVGITIKNSAGADQVVYVEKDFKMLNIETKLPSNGIIHAIPIYADIEFRIKAANVEDSRTLNLTTNSNMLDAVVFKINPKYTIFYDPKDIRIILTESENQLTGSRNDILEWINGINTKGNTVNNNGYKVFTKVQRGSSDSLGNYYGLFTFSPNVRASNNYYIYYYYVDSGGVPVYYAENYLKLHVDGSTYSISYELSDQESSTTSSVETETFVSPFEFKLTGSNLLKYNQIKDTINGLGLTTAEATNRKLIIYIALQLMQSGYVKIVNSNDFVTDNYFYSDTFSTSPKDSGGGDYSLSALIEIVNTNHVMGENVEIYTSPIGFYRMVYSLAYIFVKERTINYGDTKGLSALYGKTNSGDGTLFNAINTQFGYTNTTGTHYTDNQPRPGDLMKDNISSEATLVYNYYNGETKTIYTTIENVKAIMLFSCTRIANTSYTSYTFEYLDISDGSSDFEIITFSFIVPTSGLSEYQENDNYKRFLLATGDLENMSGTTDTRILGLNGYDNKDAYIISGSQNYSLKLNYDGYSDSGQTVTMEFEKVYYNNENYLYKEVGKSETKLMKIYDKFYKYTDIEAAATSTISSLLTESRKEANDNYETKMQYDMYISTLTIYKYNASNQTNNNLVYLSYTSTKMNVPSSNGTFNSTYAVQSRTDANATGNYNYTFNTLIIDYLTNYYNFEANYTSKKQANYDTYLNKELLSYYNDRYNEVKAQLDANEGSWYDLYLAWYKNNHWSDAENNYINGSLKYDSLYAALLEEKKTAVINKYRGELADEYKDNLTDEEVYDYVLTHKSTYDFSAFRTAYINANLSTLTLDQVKLYFDRNNDGVVDSDTTNYNLIRNAMADAYKNGTQVIGKQLTDDDVYQYIYEHKDESTYSSLKTAIQDYYYINMLETDVKDYFDNTSDSTNIAWVKEIMADEYENGLSDVDVYNYYIANNDYLAFKTAITNAKFSTTYIKNYFDRNNDGTVDYDTTTFNSIRDTIASRSITNDQVYEYIYNNMSTSDLVGIKNTLIADYIKTISDDTAKEYIYENKDDILKTRIVNEYKTDNLEQYAYNYLFENRESLYKSKIIAAKVSELKSSDDYINGTLTDENVNSQAEAYYNSITTVEALKPYISTDELSNAKSNSTVTSNLDSNAESYYSNLENSELDEYIETGDISSAKQNIANDYYDTMSAADLKAKEIAYIKTQYSTTSTTFTNAKNTMIAEYSVSTSYVYSYINSHQSTYSSLVSTIKEYMFSDLISDPVKASYFKSNYSTSYNNSKTAMRTIKYNSYTNDDVYSYVVDNKYDSKLSSLKENINEYDYSRVSKDSIENYCNLYSSTSAVTSAISSAKTSLRTNYLNTVTFDEVCTYYQGKQSSSNTIYSSSSTMTYKNLKSKIQEYLFDNELGGVTKDLKVSYYTSHYAEAVGNAKAAMRNEEYDRLTASDVYNRKKSEADVITEAKGNITRTEKDNMIAQQAKIDTTQKVAYEELKANEYKEEKRTTAEATADSMIKYEAYLVSREAYLTDLAGKTKQKLAYEYVVNNYVSKFQSYLNNYDTYSYSETGGTNYNYQTITNDKTNTVQCRIYMFKANIWYYNLTGNDYTYNKTSYTGNDGYDGGRIWIIQTDSSSGNVKNIYTRFSSFFV